MSLKDITASHLDQLTSEETTFKTSCFPV